MGGTVVAVAQSATHSFSKPVGECIRLLAGLGVEGDAHLGATVQHRSRIAKFGHLPNLRQVHLMQAELLDELHAAGFAIKPGDMGENVTTQGLDLLGLPTATLLRLGDTAIIEVTGLRNPCRQLNDFRPGLMQATLDRDAAGNLIRKAGIMATVVTGGAVRAGDPITVTLPAGTHRPLEPV
ncbi:MAG: MOSC domain-containing protein [Alphaproteobacteria bacterium]|nr:MOSC domain-containing protein [Alphaproteobacteria bacterium]